MATSKRQLIAPRGDKRFVRRNAKGRITESDDVGRSLTQDRQRRAKSASTPGQGDKGDRSAASTATSRKTPMNQTSARKSANGNAAGKSSGNAKKTTGRKTSGSTSKATPERKRSSSSSAGSATGKRAARSAARAPNAIQLLKADHATVRELLTRLEESTSRGAKTREELLARIRRELEVHTTIEEEIFYPAFKAAGERQDDAKMYFEAMEEHRAAGDLVLPDLLSTDPASECFGGRAKVLKELIEHHAKEEEREMFPRARELLSAETLSSLGETMLARKQALMAQPAPPKSIAGRMLSAVVGAIDPDESRPAKGERAGKRSRSGTRTKSPNGATARRSAQ